MAFNFTKVSPKFARFVTIFRDFLRRKTVGQLHHGRLRYRAWYRWKACKKSFPTVLSSTSNIGVVQKIQWKNRRKSRAFGGGETLFSRGKKCLYKSAPHGLGHRSYIYKRRTIFTSFLVRRRSLTSAEWKKLSSFTLNLKKNGPHKVLPLICFDIYGLGGSGADGIHCRPIFQGFKMTKNIWKCMKMYDFELWWCLTNL